METRIYIGEAAKQLDRQIQTIRKWGREDILPEDLKPSRDERDWRYWTPEQIENIKHWMKEIDLRPGKGLPHNQNPSEEKVREHLRKLRQPRGSRSVLS